MGKNGNWTESEVLQVRLLMEQGKSDEEIAAIVGRTAKAVARKRQRKGWKRDRHMELVEKATWTRHELEFIRLYWRELTDKKLAAKLGKSVAAVRRKRTLMGFRKDWEVKEGRRRSWSYEDEEMVRRFYGRHGAEDIRRYLRGKHTVTGIRQKAQNMGLKKEEWGKWGRRGLESIAEYYQRMKSGQR